jgi:hypothetical protein
MPQFFGRAHLTFLDIRPRRKSAPLSAEDRHIGRGIAVKVAQGLAELSNQGTVHGVQLVRPRQFNVCNAIDAAIVHEIFVAHRRRPSVRIKTRRTLGCDPKIARLDARRETKSMRSGQPT